MNTPASPPVDPGVNGSVGVERLGFARDHVVQEFGWDRDVDDDFRAAVEEIVGAELEDDEYTGVADAVILWWRADDGDVSDALMDLVGVLEDGGFVALLTPRSGGGEIEASELDEAAVVAGLHLAGTFTAGQGWRAHKLVAPKGNGRR